MKYKAILFGALPYNRDDKSYLAAFTQAIECEAEDAEAAHREFSIRADAEQRARRAHDVKGLLVRYVLDAE